MHAGFEHLDYENVSPGGFQKDIAMLVMLAVFGLSILLIQIGLGWRAFTCTAMFEEQKSGEKKKKKRKSIVHWNKWQGPKKTKTYNTRYSTVVTHL